MRFDDTNPAKENTEFENIILEDVKLLNIDYDIFSFTSNHFPAMLEYAEEMIQKVLISSRTLRHLLYSCHRVFLRAIAIMIKCNEKNSFKISLISGQIYIFVIFQGLAYVDDTDPAVMKEEREKREESANRSNSKLQK